MKIWWWVGKERGKQKGEGRREKGEGDGRREREKGERQRECWGYPIRGRTDSWGSEKDRDSRKAREFYEWWGRENRKQRKAEGEMERERALRDRERERERDRERDRKKTSQEQREGREERESGGDPAGRARFRDLQRGGRA